jgi:uncharacterized protein (DUF2141 family)
MGKSIIISLFLLSTVFMAGAQEVEITVQIDNISNDKGQMMVALYNKEAQWLKNHFMGAKGSIQNGKCQVVFKNVPEGVYAISTFHDKNGNEKLDMLMGMIPKEPIGTSNNAPMVMGPPKWKDAHFSVKDVSLQLNITL